MITEWQLGLIVLWNKCWLFDLNWIWGILILKFKKKKIKNEIRIPNQVMDRFHTENLIMQKIYPQEMLHIKKNQFKFSFISAREITTMVCEKYLLSISALLEINTKTMGGLFVDFSFFQQGILVFLRFFISFLMFF